MILAVMEKMASPVLALVFSDLLIINFRGVEKPGGTTVLPCVPSVSASSNSTTPTTLISLQSHCKL
jgi:hypothetical protein